jgi:hypothetical protein
LLGPAGVPTWCNINDLNCPTGQTDPQVTKGQFLILSNRADGSATPLARYARCIQTRIDLIEDEMSALEKQGAAHFECARLCLRELDDLAVARFQLLAAVACIERRLLQATSQLAEAAQ